MSEYRTYNAGDLEPMRKVTKQDQLKNSANFIDENGQLCLQQCMACSDYPNGRENYYAYVLSGTCAWCNWGKE